MNTMDPEAPQGHADIAELRAACDELSPDYPCRDEDSQQRLIALCERFFRLLEPFALVNATNERWRDEVSAMADTLLVALPKDSPLCASLDSGLHGLERYEELVQSEKTNQMEREESNMDARTVLALCEKDLQILKEYLAVYPPEEWRISNAANSVHERSGILLAKISESPFDESLSSAADQLLRNLAASLYSGRRMESLPPPLQDELEICADRAARRVKTLAEMRKVSSRGKIQLKAAISGRTDCVRTGEETA